MSQEYLDLKNIEDVIFKLEINLGISNCEAIKVYEKISNSEHLTTLLGNYFFYKDSFNQIMSENENLAGIILNKSVEYGDEDLRMIAKKYLGLKGIVLHKIKNNQRLVEEEIKYVVDHLTD